MSVIFALFNNFAAALKDFATTLVFLANVNVTLSPLTPFVLFGVSELYEVNSHALVESTVVVTAVSVAFIAALSGEKYNQVLPFCVAVSVSVT